LNFNNKIAVVAAAAMMVTMTMTMVESGLQRRGSERLFWAEKQA
jgi:hypothetical protein